MYDVLDFESDFLDSYFKLDFLTHDSVAVVDLLEHNSEYVYRYVEMINEYVNKIHNDYFDLCDKVVRQGEQAEINVITTE